MVLRHLSQNLSCRLQQVGPLNDLHKSLHRRLVLYSDLQGLQHLAVFQENGPLHDTRGSFHSADCHTHPSSYQKKQQLGTHIINEILLDRSRLSLGKILIKLLQGAIVAPKLIDFNLYDCLHIMHEAYLGQKALGVLKLSQSGIYLRIFLFENVQSLRELHEFAMKPWEFSLNTLYAVPGNLDYVAYTGGTDPNYPKNFVGYVVYDDASNAYGLTVCGS